MSTSLLWLLTTSTVEGARGPDQGERMLQLASIMTHWVALHELLLPIGPQLPQQETIEVGLDDPQGLLPVLLCATVITMTNVFLGWNVSA